MLPASVTSDIVGNVLSTPIATTTGGGVPAVTATTATAAPIANNCARVPRQRVSMMSRTFYLQIVGRDVIDTCAPGVTIKEAGDTQFALDHITREAIPIAEASHLLITPSVTTTSTTPPPAAVAEPEEAAVAAKEPSPPPLWKEELEELRAALSAKTKDLEVEAQRTRVAEGRLAAERKKLNGVRAALDMPAEAVLPIGGGGGSVQGLVTYTASEDITAGNGVSHEPSVAPPAASSLPGTRNIAFETSQVPRSTTTMPRSVSPLRAGEGGGFGGLNLVTHQSMPSISPAPNAIPIPPMHGSRALVDDRSQAQPRVDDYLGTVGSVPHHPQQHLQPDHHQDHPLHPHHSYGATMIPSLLPPVPPGADWVVRTTPASEGAFPHIDLLSHMAVPPPPFGQRLYYCHRTRVFVIPGKVKEYIADEIIPLLRGDITVDPTHFRLLLRRKGFLPSFMSLKVVSPEERTRAFPLFFRCFDEVLPWCPFCLEEVPASLSGGHLRLARHYESRRAKGLEGEEPRDPISDAIKEGWGQTRLNGRHPQRRDRSPSPAGEVPPPPPRGGGGRRSQSPFQRGHNVGGGGGGGGFRAKHFQRN